MAEQSLWVTLLPALLAVLTFYLGQRFQSDRDAKAAERAHAERQEERAAARDDRDALVAAEAAERQRQREAEAAQTRQAVQDAHRQAQVDDFIAMLQASHTMIEELRIGYDLRMNGGRADAVLTERSSFGAFITAIARLRIRAHHHSGYDAKLAALWTSVTEGYVELHTRGASALKAQTAFEDLEAFVLQAPADLSDLLAWDAQRGPS